MTLINYWRSSSLLFHLGNHAKWLSYASVSIDLTQRALETFNIEVLKAPATFSVRYGSAEFSYRRYNVCSHNTLKESEKRWKGRPPPLAQRSPVTAHINFNLVSPNLLNPPCDIFTLKCTRTKASEGGRRTMKVWCWWKFSKIHQTFSF